MRRSLFAFARVLANTRHCRSDGATPFPRSKFRRRETCVCRGDAFVAVAGGKPVVGGSQVCGVGGGPATHVVTSPLVPLRRLLLDFPPIEGCCSPIYLSLEQAPLREYVGMRIATSPKKGPCEEGSRPGFCRSDCLFVCFLTMLPQQEHYFRVLDAVASLSTYPCE